MPPRAAHPKTSFFASTQGKAAKKSMPDTQPDPSKVENQPETRRHAVQPSGYDGSNPATAGPGNTSVQSPTPETKKGEINPSAPNDANRTPDRG
jgi:hypothetical protein